MIEEKKQRQALEKCRFLLEQKFNLKNSETWTHKDFIFLSDLIFENTGVRLNYNTLKRIWGKVAGINSPSVTTLDTLVKIIGFSNWNQFLINNTDKNITTLTPTRKKIKLPYRWIVAILMILIVIAGLQKIKNSPLFTMNYDSLLDSIKVECLNPIDSFPHTVVFQYSIPKKIKDSVFLFPQYQKPVYLDPERNVSTVLFLFPGFYKVTLKANKDTLSMINIHTITNGWAGMANMDETTFVSFGQNKMPKGRLFLHPDTIKREHINTNQSYWTRFFNINDFGFSCDSIIVELSLKNTAEEGGLSCYNSAFSLWGEHGIAEIMLTQKGCTNWARFEISEKKIDGSLYDLSNLGVALNEWYSIKIVIKDKTFTAYHDNTVLFATNYSKPIGPLKGLRFRFKGSGSVDFLQLQSSDGRFVTRYDF